MKKFILIVLMSLMLVGCAPDDKLPMYKAIESPVNSENFDLKSYQLTYLFYMGRFEDKEAGVVCYLYSSGIDCLPISETLLGE